MALAVIGTESGRAMLLNAAMKQANLNRLLGYSEWLSIWLSMMIEPWPHWVHYRGGRANYCPPDTFGFMGEGGPSDCDWMVPGTHEC